MAVPNLNTAATTIEGHLATVALTTTAQTVVAIDSAAIRTVRLRSMFVSNKTASTQAVTVNIVRGGNTYPVVFQASVIRNSIYNMASLDDSLYMEPGDTLQALAGANSALTLFVSYEDCI